MGVFCCCFLISYCGLFLLIDCLTVCLPGQWVMSLLRTPTPFPLPLTPNYMFVSLPFNGWCKSKVTVPEYYPVINIFCFEKSAPLCFSANPTNWDYQTLSIFIFIWHRPFSYCTFFKKRVMNCLVYVYDLCRPKIKYFIFRSCIFEEQFQIFNVSTCECIESRHE